MHIYTYGNCVDLPGLARRASTPRSAGGRPRTSSSGPGDSESCRRGPVGWATGLRSCMELGTCNIYIYTYTYIHTSTYIYIFINISKKINIYIYIYIHTYACVTVVVYILSYIGLPVMVCDEMV